MRLRCILACIVWIQRLAIGTIATATTPAKGGTRCFCNEASCVRTGYMCKSLLSACFSLLSPDGQGFRSTHGCADSLPETSRGACANGSHAKEVQLSEDNDQTTQRQRLLCCRQDMCNYMDGSNVVLLSAISNSNKNGSATKSSPADAIADKTDARRRELWFRVAVIAVPMIGLFVLILLVGAAVRMLRGDARRHQVANEQTDMMTSEVYKQLIHGRQSAASQGIRVCDGFCEKRDQQYPATCWVDFSDLRTCAHTACVIADTNCNSSGGGGGVRIYPVQERRTMRISVEKPCSDQTTRVKESDARAAVFSSAFSHGNCLG